MSEQSDALLEKLAPYRATPGILAAMLVQRDGFVVAADADEGSSVDAVAAQVAGVIDVGARLATELGQADDPLPDRRARGAQRGAGPVRRRADARPRRRAVGTLTCEYRIAARGA